MSVDWSKAPEGATHHCSARNTWFKNDEHDMWLIWQSYGRMHEKPLIGWCFCSAPDGDSLSAKEWTGEGLPPVGTVCEFKANILGWVQASITAVTELSIVFTRPSYQNGRPLVEDRLPHKAIERFRPIRTPEQIAAEERELAITDICLLLDKDPSRPSLREKAGIIYDAGYRKQAQP